MTRPDVEVAELALDDRRGHEAYAAVWNSVVLREPVTAGEVARNRARTPDDVRFVARVDWAIAGCASALRSDIEGRTFTALLVLPEQRRRGVGTALLRRVLDTARGHGSTHLATSYEEGEGDGAVFSARYGLEEVARSIELSLRLTGREPLAEPPDGIELAPLAERSDAVEGAYRLASEALADLPVPGVYRVPSLERWLDDEVRGAALREATLVALEGGRVVGFASLLRREADPRLAEHGLLAVARTHRRRGLGTALKRAQIAWAARHGYRELLTVPQAEDVASVALNERLGYERRAVWVRAEAPLDRVESLLPG